MTSKFSPVNQLLHSPKQRLLITGYPVSPFLHNSPRVPRDRGQPPSRSVIMAARRCHDDLIIPMMHRRRRYNSGQISLPVSDGCRRCGRFLRDSICPPNGLGARRLPTVAPTSGHIVRLMERYDRHPLNPHMPPYSSYTYPVPTP